ncbi:xanthine dehydrogenase family protein molybdopterin-binding subunit [Acidisoma silvae]|uniref:xanthine dehydrogenase family protein molybdopterin-binding subunit n=1 Tax=Acidisoma silvae TaxID=2802396 RepID=UPI0022213786|nr:molybdopterin cofactor-binding domain-containing protein [Acidisoma silvae]
MAKPPRDRRRLISRRVIIGSVGAGAAAVSLYRLGPIGILGKVAELAPEEWIPGGKPDPLMEAHGLVGAALPRLDGPCKVRGAAAFAAEVAIDDMTYAAFAFSTVAKGRLATLDTSAAEQSPGVILVMTHRNAPRMRPGAAGDLPLMQDDRIHWNGQPIAVVLAETQEQADHASSLIQATYDVEPAVTRFDAAKQRKRHVLYFGEPLQNTIGDPEAALVAAPFKVDQSYRTPFHNHNAMEPHAATVAWRGDALIVHDSTQSVRQSANAFTRAFDLKAEQISIRSPFVGGGFGAK